MRFQDPATGRWLDTEDTLAAPPITSLRDLQAASLRFESTDSGDGGDQEKWLAQLFAPGSSLGGARPKASIRNEHGALCIARFPSKQGRRDIGAWELVAHRLAAKAGITVTQVRPIRVAESAYTTFVAKRFDRTASGRRLAFVAAMTLTQRTDGEPGASYLELVDMLPSQGAEARSDCREIVPARRLQGIRLSPVFDINPAIDRNELALAINEVESTCDVAIAMEAHADYGLTAAEAKAIITKTRNAVASWRSEASRLRIPKAEQEEMARAFVSKDPPRQFSAKIE